MRQMAFIAREARRWQAFRWIETNEIRREWNAGWNTPCHRKSVFICVADSKPELHPIVGRVWRQPARLLEAGCAVRLRIALDCSSSFFYAHCIFGDERADATLVLRCMVCAIRRPGVAIARPAVGGRVRRASANRIGLLIVVSSRARHHRRRAGFRHTRPTVAWLAQFVGRVWR